VVTETELIDAEEIYLKGLVTQLQQRITDLEALKLPRKGDNSQALEEKLEALPWKLARSGKCYWVRGDEVVRELKDLISKDKDGFKTENYHYTLTKDGNVLRFERHKEAPQK
jgi:hypothetical protein